MDPSVLACIIMSSVVGGCGLISGFVCFYNCNTNTVSAARTGPSEADTSEADTSEAGSSEAGTSEAVAELEARVHAEYIIKNQPPQYEAATHSETAIHRETAIMQSEAATHSAPPPVYST